MQDLYKNIYEYNQEKKCKILIILNEMIANMLNNKSFNQTVTDLFIYYKKETNFFITKSYFALPQNAKLNSTHFFIKKVVDKWELEQIASNHLFNIYFKDIIILQNMYYKTIFFLVDDTTLTSDNILRFKRNLSERTLFNHDNWW